MVLVEADDECSKHIVAWSEMGLRQMPQARTRVLEHNGQMPNRGSSSIVP